MVRKTQVRELGDKVALTRDLLQQDVLGLDVVVSALVLVHERQGRGNLPCYSSHALQAEKAFLDERPDIAAVHVLNDEAHEGGREHLRFPPLQCAAVKALIKELLHRLVVVSVHQHVKEFDDVSVVSQRGTVNPLVHDNVHPSRALYFQHNLLPGPLLVACHHVAEVPHADPLNTREIEYIPQERPGRATCEAVDELRVTVHDSLLLPLHPSERPSLLVQGLLELFYFEWTLRTARAVLSGLLLRACPLFSRFHQLPARVLQLHF
mmetsp:Transcript_58962/g.164775  ORF Transcript_58962/g.164775 Transcript_58962/m.164775 type:complete len:265 (+) Transcript_58962:474-1268(+)